MVVPLYNKADYVVRTLSSAIEQLSPADEIIVVDDGSTDDGAGLVLSLFSDVILIRQANGGEASARNVGVLHANSDWVAFLDADDTWYPDHLLELRALIAKYPDVHMVATAYKTSPPSNRYCPRFPRVPQRRRANIVRMTRKNLGAFWTSALAVRKETLESEGGFTLHGYGADVDTWLKIGVKYPCAYSSRPTATYYTGHPGVMQSQRHVAEQGEHGGPIVRTITDLPGLSHILEAAADSTSLVTRSAARRYRNGRVCQALRIAIRNDHPKQAAALTSLFQGPIGIRACLYLGLAKLPPQSRRKLIRRWLRLFR